MLTREIPLSETGMFPKIVLDYLSGNDFLKQFYTYSPSIDSFEKAIKNKQFDESKRKLLVEVLLDQYQKAGIGVDEKTRSQIELLNSSETYTVTTGHQLCLFTGPLYFIYKILTTIKLAEELKEKYPSQNFVPLFWMASEDHDFAEINHFHLFNRTFTWDILTNNQPVGRIETKTLASLIDEVKVLFSNSEQLPQLLQLFEDAYLNSDNLSVATQKIVHALFADYGLLILEPDNIKLKQSFSQIMIDDIIGQKSFAALSQTNSKLEENYKLQINGREINFFYLSASGRNLIKQEGERFVIANTDISFTADQIKQQIQTNPERFSPNVVLRPVYQEMILPNLAYIGGPGEIAYWLQLKEVFAIHQVPFPVLWLRNSFMLVNKGLQQRIDKTGLAIADFFLSSELLSKKYLGSVAGFDFNAAVTTVDEQIQFLIDETKKLDNQLASKVIKYKTEQQAFFNKLRKEVNEKVKEKAEQDLLKVVKIKDTLFPQGSPQERFDTFLQYQSSNYSFLIDVLHESSQVNTFSFRVISI